jgi:hypothetical protein
MLQESSSNEPKKIRILNEDIYELIAYMHIFINVPKEITTLVYQAHKTKYIYTPFVNPGDHDLILILKGGHRQIEMNLNKDRLSNHSNYFKTILSPLKSGIHTMTIFVRNANAVHDVIASLYNQKKNLGKLPKWEHVLETINYKSYFGMEIIGYSDDMIKLINKNMAPLCDIPYFSEEGFELLLDVAKQVGYSDDIIKLIGKNMPASYDTSNFSKELLDKLANMVQ